MVKIPRRGLVKRFIHFLGTHTHKWKVIKTIWPYKDGWGVHCEGCETTLDTGLPRHLAEEIARVENEKKS